MGKFGASKFKLGLSGVKYFPPMSCSAGGFDAGSQVAQVKHLTFGCEKLYEADMDDSTAEDLPYGDRQQADINTMRADAYPNPLRGIKKATNKNGKSGPVANNYRFSGARMVADAVNAGYQVHDGLDKPAIQNTYAVNIDVAGKEDLIESILPLEANTVATHGNLTQAGAATMSDDATVKERAEPKCSWHMAGASSYTFRPREPRGTILAITVCLQADPNMF